MCHGLGAELLALRQWDTWFNSVYHLLEVNIHLFPPFPLSHGRDFWIGRYAKYIIENENSFIIIYDRDRTPDIYFHFHDEDKIHVNNE